MKPMVSRSLLALSAAIFAFGALMHALAFFAKASAGIDRAQVAPFMGAELKVLWLADSTTLLALALLTGLLALKPAAGTGPLIVLVAAIPAASTLLLYAFLGPFYAAHLLLAASAMTVIAGAVSPGWRA